MNVRPTDLLLLDTTILVHWARQDRTGQFLRNNYLLDQRLERPLFSTVSEGEILGLAKCWKWGAPKRNALAALVNELVRFESSSPEVVEAYAELYFEDQRRSKHTGENDLWIAACAKATDSILLTCDKDFLWLTPGLVKVEHVPEIK
jgi:predicted nucleic acid-binding protein